MRSSEKIPIWLYHAVGECPQADAWDGRRADLWVPVDAFDRQFRYLQDSGYVPIDLESLRAWQVEGVGLPERSVLLTFDDGNASTYTTAHPLSRPPHTGDVLGRRGSRRAT